MIDREHDLPIAKQAEVLRISRGSVYYLPRPVPEADLATMRRLDRLHLEFPFAGSRMLRGLLAAEGCKIGRRHVKTLMQRMGIEALYRRPRTTKPEPGHKIYPYLLRGVEITRPNQVWAMDLTYIPMERGFVYLAVVLDWFSRRVLSWGISITMEAAFCVETLKDALRHGKPEIFNTDQGSQFTGAAFTGVLIENGIAISMDGTGAWRDNVFVERLWRSVKYEEVYLRAYDTTSEARASIGRYLDFYNRRRPHSSLDGGTPDHTYFTSANPHGSLTMADAPLIDAENLFRQPRPPQSSARQICPATAVGALGSAIEPCGQVFPRTMAEVFPAAKPDQSSRSYEVKRDSPDRDHDANVYWHCGDTPDRNPPVHRADRREIGTRCLPWRGAETVTAATDKKVGRTT